MVYLQEEEKETPVETSPEEGIEEPTEEEPKV